MEVETFRSIGAGHGSDEESRSISDPFVAVVARHPAVPASAAAVDAEEQVRPRITPSEYCEVIFNFCFL